MGVPEQFCFLSLSKSAKKLNLRRSEMLEMIRVKIIPPPMRDAGGKRKYYNTADLVEMQMAIEKFKAQE